MRSRTIREGSVGLLILLGLGLFGALVLWIRDIRFGERSYRVVVEFADTAGIQQGAPVRYRGVPVGRIVALRPGPNAVDVEIEITQSDLVIPRDVLVEANQSGLISETSVDITPLTLVSTAQIDTKPLDPDCNNALIICDGARLQGEIGVSTDRLIRASVRFAEVFSDPVFFGQLQTLTQNTSEAAAGVTVLTRELSGLSQSIEQQLGALTTSASASANSVGQAANQISLTAAQASSLLDSNRAGLVSTLDNLSVTSGQLRLVVDRIAPLDEGEQGQFIRNLEILSANAAEASANLRDLSAAASDPTNLLVLQQTLDSARATFQNAQKITADLDDLTGDPAFRENLRNLVNGLSGLVSTTQQLQQQTQLAHTLAHTATTLNAEAQNNTQTQSNISIQTPNSSTAPHQPDTSTSAAAQPATNDMATNQPANFHPITPEQLSRLYPYTTTINPYTTINPTIATPSPHQAK